MWGSDCLSVNGEGHLTIGGVDTLALAKEYGTPLYVLDKTEIVSTLTAYKQAMERYCENGGTVSFASKACCFEEIYRLVEATGCFADVVSGGEAYTALSAGFPAEHLLFHGNCKTDDELRMSLEKGIGYIIVDNDDELEALDRIAGEMNRSAPVMLRITPGIDAHTHDFVKTGQIDSKFGFTLENGEALASACKAVSLSHIRVLGVHCHIGSQIFDEEPFALAATVMMRFLADVRKACGAVLPYLNLGGGFGVRYVESDTPRPIDAYVRRMVEALSDSAKAYDYPVPHLIIEPGRAIVAPAGITLYTVGNVKTIPGVRTYINTDGGMADNPRYALYGSDYTVLNAGCAGDAATCIASVAGRCCESGDLIGEDMPIQPCKRGDILAVLATGAYNYSMASHYNRLPNPPVVMTENGTSRIVVKGETYDDLIKNDI